MKVHLSISLLVSLACLGMASAESFKGSATDSIVNKQDQIQQVENLSSDAPALEKETVAEMIQPPGRVYCDRYANGNTYGFSLYRRDGLDLGNAVWTDSMSYECYEAADVANRSREGLMCGRYYNKNTAITSYSVYRVRDNVDLGYATIGDFATCQTAVRTARRGLFCSTYNINGTTRWSLYSIATGQDVGHLHYATIGDCLRYL